MSDLCSYQENRGPRQRNRGLKAWQDGIEGKDWSLTDLFTYFKCLSHIYMPLYTPHPSIVSFEIPKHLSECALSVHTLCRLRNLIGHSLLHDRVLNYV